jgi:hypothetical protein
MKHPVAELLPFYLNGTLDAAERARVEAELVECAACRAELAELRDLAGVLRARAAAMPAPSPQLFERARARIAAPPVLSAARIRSAWWGTTARYAAAVVLVASVSAGAVAAWHAHEAAVARDGVATSSGDAANTLVYRVSPAPRAERVAALAATGQSVARPHRVTRTARVTLEVYDIPVALTHVSDIVAGPGTFIDGSPHFVPAANAGFRLPTSTITISAGRLDDALDRFSALGTLKHRVVEATDLEPVLTADANRLREARREASALHAAAAMNPQAEAAARVRMRAADARIRQDDATLRRDEARAATGTIVLTLTERS